MRKSDQTFENQSVSHGHRHDLATTRDVRRILNGAAGFLALLTLVGMFTIGFGSDARREVPEPLGGDIVSAVVQGSKTGACSGTLPADDLDCLVFTVEITQGPELGDDVELEFPAEADNSPQLGPGDRIVVTRIEDQGGTVRYQYADRQRRPALIVLAIVFAVVVVLLGRWRGLAALGGLVMSVFIILQFLLPAILDGHSPLVVAVLASSAIAFLALYLAHGLNTLTTVALLGTLASLALTILLSQVFTNVAHLSGLNEESLTLAGLTAGTGILVDPRGLLLAGIVIGALGALDDMTVTQASAVSELARADPRRSRAELFRSAIRIGRDHVASTVNTLALAYAGAALPTLLLLVLSRQSLGTVANGEFVAAELVRTLVGSVGLVASVPITTWLATVVVTAERRHGTRGTPIGVPVRAPRVPPATATSPQSISYGEDGSTAP